MHVGIQHMAEYLNWTIINSNAHSSEFDVSFIYQICRFCTFEAFSVNSSKEYYIQYFFLNSLYITVFSSFITKFLYSGKLGNF